MSTEVATRQDDSSLAQKIEWAKTMAVANLLPSQYQGNPGNLLYAIEYADALGIDRINAITSIHVINGKPSASADLIAALIRKAGHKLRVTGDDTHAIAQIIRADDPDFTYESTWDIKKAQAANLWGKGNWRTYPGAMLKARAITEVARMGASDALYGVIYTPEELGSEAPEPPPQTGRAVLEAALAQPAPAEDEPTTEPSDDFTPDPITRRQLTALNAAVTELGFDRGQKLAGVAATIGREVETTKDLTKDEATRVIKALKAEAEKRQMDSATEVVQGELIES